MKIAMREDLIEDTNIPSVTLDNVYYSADEIADAEVISQDEESGDVVAKLTDGRIVCLYSADLDFIG